MLPMENPLLSEPFLVSKLLDSGKKKSEISPSGWDTPMLRFTNAQNVKLHNATNPTHLLRKITLIATMASAKKYYSL